MHPDQTHCILDFKLSWEKCVSSSVAVCSPFIIFSKLWIYLPYPLGKEPIEFFSNPGAHLKNRTAERVGNSMRLPVGKRVKTSFPLRRSLRCRSLFIRWCENAITSDQTRTSAASMLVSWALQLFTCQQMTSNRFVYLWKHFGGHGGNKIYYHFIFNLCSIVQIRTGVVTPGTGCDTVGQVHAPMSCHPMCMLVISPPSLMTGCTCPATW